MQSSNDDRMDGQFPAGEPNLDLTLSNGTSLGGSGVVEGRASRLTNAITMEVLLKGLRRRWLLALTLGLITAVVSAAGAWHFLPPGKLSARVLLHVDSIPPTIMFREVQSQTNFQIYQRT